MEELLELERFNLVQDNIRVAETLETQQLMSAGSQILQESSGPPLPNMQPPTAGPTGSAPVGGAG